MGNAPSKSSGSRPGLTRPVKPASQVGSAKHDHSGSQADDAEGPPPSYVDAIRGGEESFVVTKEENPLELLRAFDTVVIVDDSSSMRGARWIEARDALAAVAVEAGKYDTDGIEIAFLNNRSTLEHGRGAAEVQELFDRVTPTFGTPIGERLREIVEPYLDALDSAKMGKGGNLKGIKPINYIVLTDGVPSDDPEDVIVEIASRLDRNHYPLTQVGIQFVQIGNSRSAAEYLMELDNDLVEIYEIRDIVDTTPYSGVITGPRLIKILLGGINRRIDNSIV